MPIRFRIRISAPVLASAWSICRYIPALLPLAFLAFESVKDCPRLQISFQNQFLMRSLLDENAGKGDASCSISETDVDASSILGLGPEYFLPVSNQDSIACGEAQVGSSRLLLLCNSELGILES